MLGWCLQNHKCNSNDDKSSDAEDSGFASDGASKGGSSMEHVAGFSFDDVDGAVTGQQHTKHSCSVCILQKLLPFNDRELVTALL